MVRRGILQESKGQLPHRRKVTTHHRKWVEGSVPVLIQGIVKRLREFKDQLSPGSNLERTERGLT